MIVVIFRLEADPIAFVSVPLDLELELFMTAYYRVIEIVQDSRQILGQHDLKLLRRVVLELKIGEAVGLDYSAKRIGGLSIAPVTDVDVAALERRVV